MKEYEELKQLLALQDESNNDKIEEEFQKFQSQYAGESVPKRLSSVKAGVLEIAMKIIQAKIYNSAEKVAWKYCERLVLTKNVDDEEEMLPIEAFANAGGVEECALEVQRPDVGSQAHQMFFILAWSCTNENVSVRAINAGAHIAALKFIKKGEYLDIAMSFIRTASANPLNTAALKEAGAIDVVLPFLKALEKENISEGELRNGFRAGSMIARICGKDEEGVGPQVLQGNPILIKKTTFILEKVLDSGASGAVYGMLINPHLITMDLLTISKSDANKLLLLDSLPILLRALRERGMTNEKMTIDLVLTFFQVSFEKTGACKAFLVANSKEICTLLQKIIVAPTYSQEVLMSSQLLQNTINPPALETLSKAPSKLGGLFKKAIDANKLGTRRKSAVTDQKHVMLSYNWGVQPIVVKIDELLRARGIKVWLDIRDMGPNLNDSMAEAIENASMLFVFMTAAYKESANCRKECEYADGQKIPINYVMAEQGYKPNGWLGIQLAKAIYIEVTSQEQAEQNISKFVERIPKAQPSLHVAPAVAVPSSVKPPTSPTVTTNSNSIDALVTLMQSFNTKIDLMNSKLDSLTSHVADLDKKISELKNKKEEE